MVTHLFMLHTIRTKHPLWTKHRHNIVTLDRICSFTALAQVRLLNRSDLHI